MKNGNGSADPIEAARQQQQQPQLPPGGELAAGLHTVLGPHQHADVINACLVQSAARARMAGMGRRDFERMALTIFDSITVERQPPPSGLLAP